MLEKSHLISASGHVIYGVCLWPVVDFLLNDGLSRKTECLMSSNQSPTIYRQPRWSTLIYVTLAVALAIGAAVLNAWQTNWALTILVALGVVLFIESMLLLSQRHPGTWRLIKWGILLLLAVLLLTGFWQYAG